MAYVFLEDEDNCLLIGTKFAIWKKPVSGDKFGPYKNPTAHLDLLRFHSDMQYLSLAVQQDVVVNHTSLAGAAGTPASGAPTTGDGSSGSAQPVASGDIREDMIDLLTHSAGGVPPYQVLYNGQVVSAGTVVQTGDGCARLVSSWVTSTKVGIKAIAFSSESDLPAADKTYRVVVFRQFGPDSGEPLYRFRPTEIQLGAGKISNASPALRRAKVGEATFYIPKAPDTDIRNGAIRSISSAGVTNDLGSYNGGLLELPAIEVTY
jgi:hypothetical protein